MPRFRYEAVDSSGVPVHGTADADSEELLIESLKERGLVPISCTELSLEATVRENSGFLDRLQQLRIGESMREALLTSLPAEDAVKAMAAEPVTHPLNGLMPWIQGLATLGFCVLLVAAVTSGSGYWIAGAWGGITFVVIPSCWLFVHWLYDYRPRQLLLILSERLRRGAALSPSVQVAMPLELKSVLQANIKDEQKARIAGDLAPQLLGSSLRGQQFALTLTGPIAMLALVFFGMHSVLLYVLPQFKKIFEDFGTSLPILTSTIISLSDVAVAFGVAGWMAVTTCLFLSVLLFAWILRSGWGSEFLASIPLAGIAFRWAMQARVARVLAAMIRSGCDYAEAIRTATAASGFRRVRRQGAQLAEDLQAGKSVTLKSRLLSGLPLSLLYTIGSADDEQQRRAAVADTFSGLAEMLDTATIGQGSLAAALLQFFTIILTGTLVLVTVFSLFLPLIKLLNDLS